MFVFAAAAIYCVAAYAMGEFTRPLGFVMLAMFVAYMVANVLQMKKAPAAAEAEAEAESAGDVDTSPLGNDVIGKFLKTGDVRHVTDDTDYIFTIGFQFLYTLVQLFLTDVNGYYFGTLLHETFGNAATQYMLLTTYHSFYTSFPHFTVQQPDERELGFCRAEPGVFAILLPEQGLVVVPCMVMPVIGT